MAPGDRWMALVGVLALIACGAWFWMHREAFVAGFETTRIETRARPFAPEEVRAFAEAARKVETIRDPLQRCLDYPDPPGSHWSRVAVVAYCQNQLSTALTFEEVSAQIEAGHAQAVDQRFEQVLRAELSGKSTPGLLEMTYETDFGCACTHSDVRPILDAWKRQSPGSAFAFAASGMAYVRAAWTARGDAWATDTPDARFATMQRLLSEGGADLDRAVALDRRMLPAYAAMIQLAGLDGDRAYASKAADAAFAVDPSNYLIYSRLTWISQPKWGGSIQAMRKVIADSRKHVKDDPLLILLQRQADAVAMGMDDCGCSDAFNTAVSRTILDHAIAKSWLGGAGLSASKAGQYGTAVIYLSEALRFAPRATDYLVGRSNALSSLGQYDWALADAGRAINLDSSEKTAWTARGYAYRLTHDYAHAEQDYRIALKLKPGDEWTLDELGSIYIYSTREYDKGWDVANQMIQYHPEDPDGWTFRASIQKDQPRSGLQDTIRYFIAHFGDDPRQQSVVAQMRPYLAHAPAQH